MPTAWSEATIQGYIGNDLQLIDNYQLGQLQIMNQTTGLPTTYPNVGMVPQNEDYKMVQSALMEARNVKTVWYLQANTFPANVTVEKAARIIDAAGNTWIVEEGSELVAAQTQWKCPVFLEVA